MQWAHDPKVDGPGATAADVDGAIVRATNGLIALLRHADSTEHGHTTVAIAQQPRAQPAVPALVATSGVGVIDGVPEPQLGFVAREELDELRGAWLEAGDGAIAITGSEGWGWMGSRDRQDRVRSTVAGDPVVHRHGHVLFWITVGERPRSGGVRRSNCSSASAHRVANPAPCLTACGRWRDALAD